MRLVNARRRFPVILTAVDAMPGGVKSALIQTAARLSRKISTEYDHGQKDALRAHFLPQADRLRRDWGIGEGWAF